MIETNQTNCIIISLYTVHSTKLLDSDWTRAVQLIDSKKYPVGVPVASMIEVHFPRFSEVVPNTSEVDSKTVEDTRRFSTFTGSLPKIFEVVLKLKASAIWDFQNIPRAHCCQIVRKFVPFPIQHWS